MRTVTQNVGKAIVNAMAAIHHMNGDHLAYGRIFGQENNLSTSAISRMNLYLHGAKDVQIMQGDTLRRAS